MKTYKILTLSAVALMASVASTVKADDAFLSPRAQGNQIRVVSSTDNNADIAQASTMTLVFPTPDALLSPRAEDNQIVKVAGTYHEPNVISAMQSLPGSPRQKLQEMQEGQPPVYEVR